jgi:hypothetical protein
MSLWFVDQPFPFFEFLREALDVNLEQGTSGNDRFSARWSTAAEKWRESTRGGGPSWPSHARGGPMADGGAPGDVL